VFHADIAVVDRSQFQVTGAGQPDFEIELNPVI
jgi:hypothetical protein